MAVVVADESRGTFVRPTKGLTVRKFLLDEWLPARSNAVKPGTAEDYRKCIVHYIVPHIGDLMMVTAWNTLGFIKNIAPAPGLVFVQVEPTTGPGPPQFPSRRAVISLTGQAPRRSASSGPR